MALCARALDLLPRLPAGRERDLLELRIIETLCRQVSSNRSAPLSLVASRSRSSARAIEIARSFGDPASSYAAITRLCNYHMITADYDRAAALSTELEPLERRDLDPGGCFSRGSSPAPSSPSSVLTLAPRAVCSRGWYPKHTKSPRSTRIYRAEPWRWATSRACAGSSVNPNVRSKKQRWRSISPMG